MTLIKARLSVWAVETKHTTNMNIKIEDINSAGIQAQARKEGITELELIGDNGEQGDAKITVYRFGATMVANTNADPIWAESDPEAWAEMMETISR